MAVFDEEGLELDAVLPPMEELIEIRSLATANFSFRSIQRATFIQTANDARERYRELSTKEGRFRDSTTFRMHLANLAELAGLAEQEEQDLRSAAERTPNSTVTERLAANLMRRGLLSNASTLLEKFPERSAPILLREAAIAVLETKFELAQEKVQHALTIDPTDYRSRFFAGALALLLGRNHEAVQHLKLALEERPSAAALSNLAIAYLTLNRRDKAISALRKAVALEPYSGRALSLFADLAHLTGDNHEVLSALERYLELEQREPTMWARLARVLMAVGQLEKAAAALKREASLDETPGVFNNLGVVYARQRDLRRAIGYFNLARERARPQSADAICASRNLLVASCELGSYESAVQLAEAIAKQDPDFRLAIESDSADIYTLLIHSLARSGRAKDAHRLAERLFDQRPDMIPGLKAWLASGIMARIALDEEPQNFEKALAIARDTAPILPQVSRHDRRLLLFKNNLAFLLIEMGRLAEADHQLSQISEFIHTEPYPTATLGLLHLRRGRIELAERLYEEAIKLAKSASDKRAIKQKMNFEFGRLHMQDDPSNARRLLSLAAQESEPTAQIARKARKLLDTLRR